MGTALGAAERQRWGGPSPWAGKDSRTEAQKRRLAPEAVIEAGLYAGGSDKKALARHIAQRAAAPRRTATLYLPRKFK